MFLWDFGLIILLNSKEELKALGKINQLYKVVEFESREKRTSNYSNNSREIEDLEIFRFQLNSLQKIENEHMIAIKKLSNNEDIIKYIWIMFYSI